MISIRTFLIIAAYLSAAICLVLVAVKIYISTSYIPDISGSETSSIFPIQRLSSGQSVYTDPEKPTFVMTQYTPLYFAIASFFVQLLDLEGQDVHKIFVVSRFLSIGFTILACVVIWFTLYKRTGKNILLASLGTCFIYQVLAFWFLTSSRPDSLLVLCFSIFLYSVLNALDRNDDSSIWWTVAAFMAITAFFVKQSGAIHSISLGLFLLSQRKWKLLLRTVVTAILFFLLYLIILPTSSLDIFFTNIVGGVANSTSWHWFYDWTLEKLLFQFAPLMALNFAIVGISLARRDNLHYQFLSICSIMLFAFSATTAFKIGAGVGYFQTYLIVSVIFLIIFLREKQHEFKLKNILNISVASIYLTLVAVHCVLYVSKSYTEHSLETFTNKYIEQRDVAQFLKNDKMLQKDEYVYICSPDDFNGYYLNHFLYQNTLVPFSDIVYLADKNDTFNFNELNEMVAENRVKYVVADKDTEPKTILGQRFPNLNKIYSTERLDVYQGY
jgi:hypothetical protein